MIDPRAAGCRGRGRRRAAGAPGPARHQADRTGARGSTEEAAVALGGDALRPRRGRRRRHGSCAARARARAPSSLFALCDARSPRAFVWASRSRAPRPRPSRAITLSTSACASSDDAARPRDRSRRRRARPPPLIKPCFPSRSSPPARPRSSAARSARGCIRTGGCLRRRRIDAEARGSAGTSAGS